MSEELVTPVTAPAEPPESRGVAAAILWPVASFGVLLLGWQFLVRSSGCPSPRRNGAARSWVCRASLASSARAFSPTCCWWMETLSRRSAFCRTGIA